MEQNKICEPEAKPVKHASEMRSVRSTGRTRAVEKLLFPC